jgi:hypothetical protein
MMTYAQLIAGFLAGLVIIGLALRTPMVRDFFAALAATGLVEILIGEHPHDSASFVDQTALALSSHPYFTMGLIVAAAAVAALYRFDPTK